MKSIYQIKQRISNLLIEIIPQTLEQKLIHKGKIDSLYWLISNDKLKTIDEINIKIKRYKEEMLAISDRSNMYYKEKQSRIQELENVLHDQ